MTVINSLRKSTIKIQSFSFNGSFLQFYKPFICSFIPYAIMIFFSIKSLSEDSWLHNAASIYSSLIYHPNYIPNHITLNYYHQPNTWLFIDHHLTDLVSSSSWLSQRLYRCVYVLVIVQEKGMVNLSSTKHTA